MSVQRSVAIAQLDDALNAVRRFWSLPALSRAQLDRAGAGSHRMGIYRVLRVLAPLGDAKVSISDVAAMLRVEVSTASRMVDQATEQELVERGVDPNDRRRTTVSLSAAGRELDRRLQGAREAILDELTADWNGDDLARLATLLSRLVGEVDEFGA